MKFQRVAALAKKNLRVLTREPGALFMLILFPIIATMAFGISFGSTDSGQTTYQIGVVDKDISGLAWSQHLVGNLSETMILNIQNYSDNSVAQSDLSQGLVQAVIIIPEDFGQSCNSYWASPTDPNLWVNTTVTLLLDSASLFATQAIPTIVQQTLEVTVYGIQPTSISGPISIGNPSLIEVSKLTTFDYFAPGFFAFFAIFSIMTVAQSFTFEREKGLLRRIKTTPTSSSEFMTSQAISNMIIAMIQVAIVFVVAILVGYRPLGDATSFISAFIILSIFSLCCVGFGLIAATLAKSSGAATGIAFIFIMPLMFLGTFVSVALSGIVKEAGKFVPSYYVTDALTSLFLRGAPVTSPTILLDILVVAVYSLVVLGAGILLYGKYGKT
ncbi:TPA: ABC transporter permease [Candidatus Bathyarchaeota archaeon]|nr:ABC transporter permease [Candidatus Bathyarchaeota archaeon]HIJ08046.1 ABC transporter permease [Candidatus Bathyarchaeota archaeon]